MKVYNLKMYCSLNDDEALEEDIYVDIWLDVEEIIGFTIPILDDKTLCTETINLFIKGGDKMTVKREGDIIEYLTKNFVEKQWN